MAGEIENLLCVLVVVFGEGSRFYWKLLSSGLVTIEIECCSPLLAKPRRAQSSSPIPVCTERRKPRHSGALPRGAAESRHIPAVLRRVLT